MLTAARTGHLGTLAYIYSTLSQLGDYYELSNQTFPAVTGFVFESRLLLDNELPESASPMSLSPPTKDKEPVIGATLALAANDGCEPSDYPENSAGNVVLIRRGSCNFGQKSKLAGQAGAVAAVVYNNEIGEVHGTLSPPDPDHIATWGLSRKDGIPLVRKLQQGKVVDAVPYMDSDVTTTLTDNIIAQTKQGDPNNCVMLGGHSDSVAEGPGINDDGSGSLSLLEVATQLTKFTVENCVRFAWWAGEEEGLLGSDYYVDQLSPEENLKIRLFMDYDMLASPNFAYQVYDARNDENPHGSEELRDAFVAWYKSQGLNYTFIPFDGRSDYDGFIRKGIPAGGIATGAEGIKTEEESQIFGGTAGDAYDVCYHQLCDDLSNLNVTAWEVNTKVRSGKLFTAWFSSLTLSQLIAHSVATFAKSLKGFPERNLDASASVAPTAKYHGHKLQM